MPFYDFIVYFGGYFIYVARILLPGVGKGVPNLPAVLEAWELVGNAPKWVGAWVGTWVLFQVLLLSKTTAPDTNFMWVLMVGSLRKLPIY